MVCPLPCVFVTRQQGLKFKLYPASLPRYRQWTLGAPSPISVLAASMSAWELRMSTLAMAVNTMQTPLLFTSTTSITIQTSSLIYESPTRATTKSASKTLMEVYLSTPTSGCFRTLTSADGVTMRTSDCFGSRARQGQDYASMWHYRRATSNA